ncbi:hypothetical protein [Paractinoplanes atraurantiacus]|uniref:Uncharacterized protein n=1 Tax=Paractinoplanes atraurantiacus TaxID=1036182 RepID=A0A285HYQ6_9ACTN|nr:hypothetical protein [Actinoplanes atraurantiacus]SNY40829.1 hypothetical protein SAMN05421748_10688 [Actinoplanes atraurantiacus]
MRKRIESAVERYDQDWPHLTDKQKKAYDGEFVGQMIDHVRRLCEAL